MPYIHITLEELYEEYISYRKIDLTFDQFMGLARFFPTLLIISTDGEVDSEEWHYVDEFVDGICNTCDQTSMSPQEKKDLLKLLSREVRYLQQNFDTWERKFTKALKLHLAEHPADREMVLNHIYQSASVSEGICEKEKIMIEYLLKELGIE